MLGGMKRTRNKGGTWLDATAKEYANSNSTSAKFLGGFQKSWMTGQKNYTIGGPHTDLSNPITAHQNLTKPQGTLQSQQGLSLSTPPQGGNLLDTHQPQMDSQSPPDQNVLPPRYLGCQYTRDPAGAGVNIESVLPSPAPSDEQRPENFQPLEVELDSQSPNVPATFAQNFLSGDLACRNGESVDLDRHDRQQNSVSTMTPPSSNATLPRVLHGQPESLGLSAALSGKANGSLEKKRKRPLPRDITVRLDDSPLEVSPNSRAGVSPCTPSSNGHRHWDEYMRYLVSAVVVRQQAVAGRKNATSNTELGRLSLLQKACAQHDHVYLLLHQIYCMYPRLSNSDQQLINVGFQAKHFKGLSMLNTLLLPNRPDLDNEAIDWFAVFPSPFEKLLNTFQNYREAMDYILMFLANFAQYWHSMQETCMSRRCPPFADEQFVVLRAGSPTLQTVVFRAMHRNVWNVWMGAINDQCYGEGERLFDKNQHKLRQRSIPLSDAEKRADFQSLMTEYRRIQMNHKRHLQGHSSSDEAHVSSMQPTSMSPPLIHGQGRLQRTQQASPINTSFTYKGNPVPSNVNAQPTGHIPIGTANRTPSVVRSPSVSRGQDQSSILRQPTMVSPLVGLRSPKATLFDRNSVVHATQLNGRPFDSQTGVHPPGTHNEQSVMFNRPRQSQAPGTNVPAPAMYGQLLLPVSGQNLSLSTQPNPMVTALHQYRARSPVLTAEDGSELEKNGMKYFQYIREVRIPDGRLRIGSRQHLEWTFELKESDVQLLPCTKGGSDGLLPRRAVAVDTETYRVRCIDASNFPGAICERDWVVARQIWPPNIAIVLNERPLDIRKKIHYGKDLPVDITTLIRQGINTLSVSIIQAQKEDNTKYAIGVERVRLLDLTAAKALTQVLPYNEAQQRILQRFQHSDPDIEVVDATLTLNMTDPHTCRIWDVPMRSTACLHDQCFDLDTFLQTRRSTRHGQPCDPEQFKCPICDVDARPQSLIKDEFFVVLRGLLAKQNRLDAKAIIMKPDSSWQIKEEEKTGEGGDGSGGSSGVWRDSAVSMEGNGIFPRKEIETIEIKDD